MFRCKIHDEDYIWDKEYSGDDLQEYSDYLMEKINAWYAEKGIDGKFIEVTYSDDEKRYLKIKYEVKRFRMSHEVPFYKEYTMEEIFEEWTEFA